MIKAVLRGRLYFFVFFLRLSCDNFCRATKSDRYAVVDVIRHYVEFFVAEMRIDVCCGADRAVSEILLNVLYIISEFLVQICSAGMAQIVKADMLACSFPNYFSELFVKIIRLDNRSSVHNADVVCVIGISACFNGCKHTSEIRRDAQSAH